MEEIKNKKFGLLGKDISYSFSRGYFSDKFKKLDLDNHSYVNFDLPSMQQFPLIFEKETDLFGMNVTIPYKEAVIPFLDEIDSKAQEIGAVNTIKINQNGTLKGFNTDVFGFENSLMPFVKKHHKRALILGTGGASKAIAYALTKNNIEFLFVSRKPKNKNEISYDDLTEKIMNEHHIIINSTPLGTSPNTDKYPLIPFQYLSDKHLLYDLIYNPEVTTFLSKGKKQGATIKNGSEMLVLQAEESWRIWNE